MKLSFSLPSKPSSSKPQYKSSSDFQPERTKGDEQTTPQYVTEFDSSKTLTQDTKLVIPPIENTWRRPEKKMRNIDPSALPSDTDMRFELEGPSTLDDTQTGISYGLNLRSKENGDDKKSEYSGPSSELKSDSIENITLQKFREDMKNLPDDRGFDEFADVPVENFAAALLGGYGWSEGKGVGRNAKEDVKVVQYVRRAGKEGLGFVSEVHDSKQKKRGSENPPLVAPKGADGRTRHVVGNDDKLVPREPKGVFVGKTVRIVDGRHVGLKGKVVEKSDGDSDSAKIVLKLSKSGEEVSVRLGQVAELGSVEEEKCLKKLQELKIQEKDDGDRRGGSDSSSHSYKERKDTEGYRRKDKWRGEEGIRDDKRRSDTTIQSIRLNSSHREEERTPFSWLRSHIRVRIISKDFKGGRLYLKKGEVMDVVGPTTCDISMDGDREIIQGVDQDILETALPKRGGPVLVLYGKHKGVFGNLMERDMDKEIGVVRDADSHELFNVRLEQIAEYIGDPSYIGY